MVAYVKRLSLIWMIKNTLLLREKFIGRSLMECHNQASREKIQQVVDWFIADDNHNIVYNFHNEKQNRNTEKMKLYDLW